MDYLPQMEGKKGNTRSCSLIQRLPGEKDPLKTLFNSPPDTAATEVPAGPATKSLLGVRKGRLPDFPTSTKWLSHAGRLTTNKIEHSFLSSFAKVSTDLCLKDI